MARTSGCLGARDAWYRRATEQSVAPISEGGRRPRKWLLGGQLLLCTTFAGFWLGLLGWAFLESLPVILAAVGLVVGIGFLVFRGEQSLAWMAATAESKPSRVIDQAPLTEVHRIIWANAGGLTLFIFAQLLHARGSTYAHWPNLFAVVGLSFIPGGMLRRGFSRLGRYAEAVSLPVLVMATFSGQAGSSILANGRPTVEALWFGALLLINFALVFAGERYLQRRSRRAASA